MGDDGPKGAAVAGKRKAGGGRVGPWSINQGGVTFRLDGSSPTFTIT